MTADIPSKEQRIWEIKNEIKLMFVFKILAKWKEAKDIWRQTENTVTEIW